MDWVSEVAVSPSLVLSFPIVVGGGMVLQAVEVSQIIKRSKSFVPVISSTCCAVQCKMVLFTFKFPCLNHLVAGVQMVLKVIWILTN